MIKSVQGGRLSNPRDRAGLIAAVVYSALTVLFLGRSIWGHLFDSYIGSGPNPPDMMAALEWWPYAIVHRLDPFYSNLIWSPLGVNIAWTTSLPLLALAMWPVTATLGPIAAFNILTLICPPLAAWTAFLLCRYLCESWWAALLGGYLFGYSAYMLDQEGSGDRHLTLIFLVPLIALAVVRAIREPEQHSAGKLICTLTALLLAEFLISNEIFATMTMFGAITLFLGWLIAPPGSAPRVVKSTLAVFCAYAAAAVLLSPWLYHLFAFAWPHGEMHPGAGVISATDLLGFVVPSNPQEIGAILARRTGSWLFIAPWLFTHSAYLGIPVLAIVAAYACGHWREPALPEFLFYRSPSFRCSRSDRACVSAGHFIFRFPPDGCCRNCR